MISIDNNMLLLDGRRIGEIKDNVLYMKRKTAVHYYRVLDSWNLNIDVVNSGVRRFVIDTDEQTRFVINLPAIKTLRQTMNLFVSNDGGERQLAIPVQCWDKYSHANLSMPVSIGVPASTFADTCAGRWKTRILARGQLELPINY